MRYPVASVLTCLFGLLTTGSVAADSTDPLVSDDVVFAELDGLVAVEAEHFAQQTLDDTRAFHLVTAKTQPGVEPDGDPEHVRGASSGAYLEVLPDTRRTHGDKLIRGTNFSPEPGRMAVLSYPVHFETPGRYYVWVRAWSTGSEDNGLHVGLNGDWPESGQRLQWCEGKHSWRWDSKQRTEQQHCGEPYRIYLDIPEPGRHTIQFSMREDGFEFDKWLMTTNREFPRPEGAGPETQLHSGQLPEAFAEASANRFPDHWGQPPEIQTQDIRPLPAGYGQGSTTLFHWIRENMEADAARSKQAATSLKLPAASFNLDETGYYLDQGKWAAIDPQSRETATASQTLPLPTGRYHISLDAVGESDGQSRYQLFLDDTPLPEFTTPLSQQMFETGTDYSHTWQNVALTEGVVLKIVSEIGTKEGQDFSRARWAAVTLTPADPATQKAARPVLARHAAAMQRQTSDPASPTKPVSTEPLQQPRQPDGDGTVAVLGDLQVWHTVTLALAGPYAHEQDNQPNPFTDYRFSVAFRHDDGTVYEVPGYFAADGQAAETSAVEGTIWKVHFVPDRPGHWQYAVSFVQDTNAALDKAVAGTPLLQFHGQNGGFGIEASDKTGRDLRAHGQLRYVGKRYLQFAGSGQYFLKAGADAPETLLAYADFDDTIAGKPEKSPLKTWQPHVQDWQPGDPSWQDGKGKGLIGAINYLSGKGCNAFSFLTYNAGGDGDNVWPFIHRDDKLHYDCSKLDQWGIVFQHGTQRGMYLHFKMQETENDDNVSEALDGGDLGVQRKLYCRELIARFGHNLALNWNLGEENTQSTAQQQAMINYIASLDPWQHNIVVHTYPDQQDQVYRPLLGQQSKLTGLSLQNSGIKDTHWQTVKWVEASTAAGKPWVVAFDESGTAAHGQCPDLGYQGFDGRDRTGKMIYTEHEVRQQTLWGTLMGGGAGVEYYFGYQFAENDLVCEDWRSRDRSWDYCRIALEFFHQHQIPFAEMQPADQLVGSDPRDNSRYCLAKPGDVYLVYLASGGTAELNLGRVNGQFEVRWFNPRTGGDLQTGTVDMIDGGRPVSIGEAPDQQDWLAVIRALPVSN